MKGKEMRELDEDDFLTIELLASRKRDKWERSYYPQDIRHQHSILWWVMQETRLYLMKLENGCDERE